VNEEQESAEDLDLDPYWGEIEDTHRAFVERFLSMLPPDGRVLDAACGPGRYFPQVLESGRSLLGVDHTDAYLANAREKSPEVRTESTTFRTFPIGMSSTA
jgi:ubiquinone/menaquinone biosynthesis C-methylase UbiE